MESQSPECDHVSVELVRLPGRRQKGLLDTTMGFDACLKGQVRATLGRWLSRESWQAGRWERGSVTEDKALHTLFRYVSIWFLVGIKMPRKSEKNFERKETLRNKAKEQDFRMTPSCPVLLIRGRNEIIGTEG